MMRCIKNPLCLLTSLSLLSVSNAFAIVKPHQQHQQQQQGVSSTTILFAKDGTEGGVEEYKNAATSILSNFMQKDNGMKTKNDVDTLTIDSDPLASIDFDTPKFQKVNLETLAQILDAELYTKEWFVNGNVNPIYFANEFEFQDPDVKLSGIENYARGVYKLFDDTSRAEIISTVVNSDLGDNVITCTWRLSGKVKIGPGDGLTIKPYIVYTDFTVEDKTGLIVKQEDRFDIPGWDILLSALFPFLIGVVTKEAAPPVVTRDPMPVYPKLLNMNSSGGSGGVVGDGIEALAQFFLGGLIKS